MLQEDNRSVENYIEIISKKYGTIQSDETLERHYRDACTSIYNKTAGDFYQNYILADREIDPEDEEMLYEDLDFLSKLMDDLIEGL